MKTTEEMMKDAQEALAHHENEAARLRAAIVALGGTPPMPAVSPFPSVPWPPSLPYIGDPQWWLQPAVICGGSIALTSTSHQG